MVNGKIKKVKGGQGRWLTERAEQKLEEEENDKRTGKKSNRKREKVINGRLRTIIEERKNSKRTAKDSNRRTNKVVNGRPRTLTEGRDRKQTHGEGQ